MANRRHRYRILTYEQKQQCIKEVHSSDNPKLDAISRKYKTSVKNILRWCRDGAIRKSGCGRKKVNENAENILEKWYIDTSLEEKKRVNRKQLKNKAIQIFNNEDFKASKAWQDEFLRSRDLKYKVCYLQISLNEKNRENMEEKQFNEIKQEFSKSEMDYSEKKNSQDYEQIPTQDSNWQEYDRSPQDDVDDYIITESNQSLQGKHFHKKCMIKFNIICKDN
ncbi:hypothetical protein pb186bvf_014615 [Paramecium bursaria]